MHHRASVLSGAGILVLVLGLQGCATLFPPATSRWLSRWPPSPIDGRGPKRVQIKGRRVREAANPGQRVGRIKFDHEWDSVILVLLDDRYEAEEIYEAEREALKQVLSAPGSKARNERGALGVRVFVRVGKKVWPRQVVR